MHAERDGATHAANRQLAHNKGIARPGHLDLIPFEGDLRIFLHVEKVGALKMSVAVRLARPDAARLYFNFDRSSARVSWIEKKRAANVFKVATNVGHHHVTHAKLRRRMSRLEKPLSHGPVLSKANFFFRNYTLTRRGSNSMIVTTKRI